MSALLNDIKYAVRQLRKNPGFTVVAVLSLALGIGANTSIFSLLNAVMFKSLPVENPHELRVLNLIGPGLRNVHQKTSNAFPYTTFCDFRNEVQDRVDVFAYSQLYDLSILTQSQSTTANGLIVSGNFFNGLGARVLIGRTIKSEDDRQGAEPVAVISYKGWQRHFGLDPEVLGQTVSLNRHSFTIIGVLPKGFLGPIAGYQSDFYTPLSAQPKLLRSFALDSPRSWWLQIMARIRPSTNDSQIQAAFNVLLNQTISTNSLSESDKSFSVAMEDGSRGPLAQRQSLAEPLFMLMGVVGIVLLVACANIAGLLLARGASRQHELSVRSTLGAGRWRLMRQSLTESLLISLLGAGLGLLLALWSKKILFNLLWPSDITFDLRSDMYVLGFTLAVSLTAALLFGLIPALRSMRTNPITSLKGRSTPGSPRSRIGKDLVSIQVGLSLLLLVGAGLFTRTVVNLWRIDTGFNIENLLVFELNAYKAGYQGKRRVDFYEQVREAIAVLPGVKAVANSNCPLLSGYENRWDGIPIPGSPSGEEISVLQLDVSNSFLTTMGIPLLQGRDFTPADNETSSKVIIVNNTLAEKVFPDLNPVGRSFTVSRTDYRIIGVCGNIIYKNVKQSTKPTVFYPYRQRTDRIYGVYFEVRTELPSLTLVPAIRKTLADIDRNIPMADIKTQKIRINESIAKERLFASLSTALALLALLLSCIGLYGVMAYNVERRTGEIGLRMALGARPKDVAWPVLRSALLMVTAGIAMGVPAVFALVKIVRNYLFGIEPYDPTTLAGTVILLILIALVAAWIPARRAAKVDPMEALRYE